MSFPFDNDFEPNEANDKPEGVEEPIPVSEAPEDSGGAPEQEPVSASGTESGSASDEFHDDPFFNPAGAEDRAAYSDAGYVPSEDASAVPPRYHCSAPAPSKEKKERRVKRRGISTAAVIALCLVCALVGGLAGGSFVGSGLAKASEVGAAEPEVTADTVINVATPGSGTVSTNIVASGKELSAGEIYSLACKQAVAITTEITYTNVFGYTSSGAVSGSGFIISSNGYILTNYHVIEDANEGGYEISVLLYDGTEYTASIVGYEEDNDIAVLKIDAEGLDAVTIGDSDSMSVGDTVYAVGNPLGELSYTMTSGMVSALDREITTSTSSNGISTTINMFQIDAAVNSGNSGGPVFNSRGEVIGIVTAKYSDTGVEGLGFAIPINDALSIANDLMTKGYVGGKAYMGITPQTVTSTIAQYYNMVVGVYVYSIEPGSCAETSGLNVGDIITKLDDTEITSAQDLVSAKKNYRAGDKATLTVYRNGEYISLSIVFDEEVPVAADSTETDDSAEQSEQEAQSSQDYTQQIPGGQYGAWGQQRP